MAEGGLGLFYGAASPVNWDRGVGAWGVGQWRKGGWLGGASGDGRFCHGGWGVAEGRQGGGGSRQGTSRGGALTSERAGLRVGGAQCPM